MKKLLYTLFLLPSIGLAVGTSSSAPPYNQVSAELKKAIRESNINTVYQLAPRELLTSKVAIQMSSWPLIHRLRDDDKITILNLPGEKRPDKIAEIARELGAPASETAIYKLMHTEDMRNLTDKELAGFTEEEIELVEKAKSNFQLR
ncbi:MAG TPA: hypothetical protein QGF02_01435 [Candidatus Babeliales bacterium]|nr:hypothetical protein [Candidatus Babeliales bacterium]